MTILGRLRQQLDLREAINSFGLTEVYLHSFASVSADWLYGRVNVNSQLFRKI